MSRLSLATCEVLPALPQDFLLDLDNTRCVAKFADKEEEAFLSVVADGSIFISLVEIEESGLSASRRF